ncbi:MAG: PQQ-binding-like beta-propeller repeat protein [Phycisphaeraceae bacterium]|nr:PQQ-binding-like beta-propeller repeat protein [Phycisphaeraceae bacterium]
MVRTALIYLLAITPIMAADWPHWGGGLGRNMVNTDETGLPTTWDVKSGSHIKWVKPLGSLAYGNPVVGQGKVFVGTNNDGLYDKALKGDKGNVLCFDEKDGTFLWQAVHDKLSAGRVNDWPRQGICSAVEVEGNLAWYLNNRCEIVCVDIQGFKDNKNNGLQDEQYQGKEKADIVWSFDMIEELGVFPHNLATSSPLILGDLLYLVTGNGVDEGHLHIPSQSAPSFCAFNKNTGELVWEYAVHGRVLHGQWSSPSAGAVNGKTQIILPGGDGLVYALDALTGELIWHFDCNPKTSEWELGGYGTKNNLIATPVFENGKVYIGVGQDPEHGTGVGHLYCIDATGTGDVTKTHQVWHRGDDDFGRTMSTAAVKDGIMYITDLAGILYALDAATGKPFWTHDLESAMWSSPMWADGKIYMGDENGKITIFAHGKAKKIINTVDMDEPVYATPVAANGVLFVATKSKIYAISD